MYTERLEEAQKTNYDDAANPTPKAIEGNAASTSGRDETTTTTTTTHYGTKPGHFETSLIHFPTSDGVSEVSASEVSASEVSASEASSPEQANE